MFYELENQRIYSMCLRCINIASSEINEITTIIRFITIDLVKATSANAPSIHG